MRTAVLVFATLSVAVYAQDRPAKFDGFKFKPPEPGAPTFMFSAGAATSKSPIRVSIPGRELTNADRVYRTNLQKYWLSQHVPPRLEFRTRVMTKCELKLENEYPFCDRYTFLDSQSGEETHYYIYIGNWP